MAEVFMQVYVLSKNVPVNAMIVLACSQTKSTLEQFQLDHKDERTEISMMNLPFEVNGISEIFTATCDVDNFKIFVDIGQYFRTKEEAQAFAKEANGPYQTEKFRVESIRIM